MLEPGKTLNGRYKIHSLLGSGGMASVYLAKDLILDRYVAVKVLRTDFHQSPDAMRRFRREALSATQLTHPNIVGVYDVGEAGGTNYIVMEYVQGTDLKEYIHQNGPLHPIEAVRIMMQIVSAIATAHQNRIIHRDIKPQNILIDRKGNVKITDFGIAIALSETSLTQTNTLLGSVHYLSPEQARGGMATVRTDIYALGIVLYELLTGHVPFDGESAVSIALKHFQEPLPRINNSQLTVPQSLENVVLRATAKEPLDRYNNCEEMYQDLSTCLDGNRLNEPMFKPHTFTGETKVLRPMTAPIRKAQPTSSRDIPIVAMEEEEEEVPTPKKKKQVPKRKVHKVLWISLVVVFLIGFVGVYALFNSSPGEVTVPDVTNMTEAQAKVALADAKLNVTETIQVPSDTVEEGKVVETDPKANSRVKEKSNIQIKVSSGQESITMKDYTNQSYDQAKSALEKLGFTVERKDQNSDSVESGKVIAQSVPANQKVTPKGTTVTLTVSKGEATFKMANLQGYPRASAVEYANSKGITLNIEEEESNATADTVIRQSIPEGREITKGTTVTVVVSKAKSETTVTRQVSIPYQKPQQQNNSENQSQEQQPTANTVQIYIQDAKNDINTVYRTMQITENTTVNLTFTFDSKTTSGSYRIVRDGQEIANGKVQ